MRTIIAIDPGSAQSGWLVMTEDGLIASGDITPNPELLEALVTGDLTADTVVIEWMSPRGMPTSAQEFEAMWWAGRFAQAAAPLPVVRLERDVVKFQLTGRRARVTDANVRAAMIDRYGGIGGKDVAIGRKANPGPLYGMRADLWQALALGAIYLESPELAHP